MNQSTLFIELHYLPCIQYFVYLSSFNKIFIDLDDVYSKQTYRNRCRINGANNVENLIIPVKKISNKKILTRNVEIDYNQKWLNKHIRAIKSAYGKAPFFEYYGNELVEIYNKKPAHLYELNKDLLTKCLEILDINLKIEFSDKTDVIEKNGVYDAKNKINPKKSMPGNSFFTSVDYFQVFGNNFVNNLSIIDLIFCEGPQARQIIGKSCVLR
ncbi:MAG: WbqC family protein [Cyclobacteriaceae bacterium]|nr:WbqC family protein [Cyclobacteriaceae bacterium]